MKSTSKFTLRRYQLIEQGILSRLKAEWIRSGSILSFEEYIMSKHGNYVRQNHLEALQKIPQKI